MLCGGLSNLSNGNFITGAAEGTRSPFSALLTLQLHNMALQSPTDNQIDHELFLENGLLNPNYHLDPARLDDALNSNMDDEDLYQEIMSELKAGIGIGTGHVSQVESRKAYATMDITSMGVDVTTGPVTNLDDNRRVDKDMSKIDNRQPFLIEDAEMRERAKSKDDVDALEESEKRDKDIDDEKSTKKSADDDDDDDDDYKVDRGLPPGWERHEDNQGPYYWHIKSGTIQRQPPVKTSVPRSCTSTTLDQLEPILKDSAGSDANKAFVDNTNIYKRRSCGPMRVQTSIEDQEGSSSSCGSNPGLIRFAVRSLGWVEVPEEELTPERSSKAVNKCIVDLSLGRNDLIDNVGRWGDGKDLFMDLDEGALKLVDPEKLTVLNTQPIHTIRVWGVGRDNGRDFAYVARDRTTRRHMCHVFRCDMPARTIANTLRDICKKIMIERSLSHGSMPSNCNKSTFDLQTGCATSGSAVRPTNLPMDTRRHRSQPSLINSGAFPTPMEEPRKILQAQYLGARAVPCAAGMSVLRAAITATVAAMHPPRHVQVAVAPSTITVSDVSADDAAAAGALVCECRVRYLSFLGIGEDVRHCGFIMHTAEDTFVAHVFLCEPSSGALCKTIEAACKLRYQKCLDAHPRNNPGHQQDSSSLTTGGLSATLKSLVVSLTGRSKTQRDSS